MSGLYNALFGYDTFCEVVLHTYRLAPEQIARFRDAWIDWADEARTVPVMVILTRTGADPAENAMLRTLQGYRSDRADTFDRTYREFVFDVAQEQDAVVRQCLDVLGKRPSLKERFERATAAMAAAR